jgi:hypothetical protein
VVTSVRIVNFFVLVLFITLIIKIKLIYWGYMLFIFKLGDVEISLKLLFTFCYFIL